MQSRPATGLSARSACHPVATSITRDDRSGDSDGETSAAETVFTEAVMADGDDVRWLPVARTSGFDTDAYMQNFENHIRTSHTVSQIRSYPAPESISSRRNSDREGAAPSAVIPIFRDAPARATDNADRVGSFTPLDAQNRIAVTKAIDPLGWEPRTNLIVNCEPNHVTIRCGAPQSPNDTCTTVDAKGRLRLPPAAVGALRLCAEEQVLLIALPDIGELRVHNARAMLTQLTGPIAAPGDAARDPAPVVGTAASGSRVRARWQPSATA